MNDPALVLTARRLRAARGVVVARDVSVTACPGDVVAVEGPTGSGKSTLLAAAAGLLPVGSGSVRPGSVGYAPERATALPPLTPMLRLSSNATTLQTSIAGPAAWLYVPGVILVAAAAILATRQT